MGTLTRRQDPGEAEGARKGSVTPGLRHATASWLASKDRRLNNDPPPLLPPPPPPPPPTCDYGVDSDGAVQVPPILPPAPTMIREAPWALFEYDDLCVGFLVLGPSWRSKPHKDRAN
jgi:hypothetical protein